MTKIGIVDDNRAVGQGLAIFINLSPDCSCVCTCDTAEPPGR
jgi:YesN/AraC family two-component response regulator